MRKWVTAVTDVVAFKANLSLRGAPGCEKVAVAAAAAAGRHVGLPSSRLDDVRTAVAEACLNGIEHGAVGPGKPLRLTFDVSHDSFRVVVTDHGRGFSPADCREPRLMDMLSEGGANRGWGLYLMQRLADSVAVKVRPAGCSVELHFSLKDGGEGVV